MGEELLFIEKVTQKADIDECIDYNTIKLICGNDEMTKRVIDLLISEGYMFKHKHDDVTYIKDSERDSAYFTKLFRDKFDEQLKKKNDRHLNISSKKTAKHQNWILIVISIFSLLIAALTLLCKS